MLFKRWGWRSKFKLVYYCFTLSINIELRQHEHTFVSYSIRTKSTSCMTTGTTRPRTAGSSSSSRGTAAGARMVNSAHSSLRSLSSKGEVMGPVRHVLWTLGHQDSSKYCFAGTYKSPDIGQEQKQTVSVYKRIEAKPTSEVNKVNQLKSLKCSF